MRKIIELLTIFSVLSVFLPASASAQEVRPEANGENLIISAVSKINAK